MMRINSLLNKEVPVRTPRVKQRPKNITWVTGLFTIIIAIIGLFWYFQIIPPHFEFIIKPVSISEKSLAVCLTIRNLPPGEETYTLYKGLIKPYGLTCQNDTGLKLQINETADTIKIFVAKSRLIRIFYQIKIAQPGKHGYRGQYYDNLLTFDGEQIILLPLAVSSGEDQAIKKSVGRITVKAILPTGWTAVTPFGKKTLKSGGVVTDLSAPNWIKIYDLVKSAYTFGDLTEHSCPGEPLFSIFVDSEAQKFYTTETLNGLKSIYSFYANLFGYKIPFSVVLLRKHSPAGEYVIGGSGIHNLAATFDPENPRDWELMAHRFFHAFFEYKISSPEFHFPPQLWFYEGLATYYENMAMAGLPEEIRKKKGLDFSRGFLALFQRYLYMRLKNPDLFAIAPMSEETISSSGQIEFLHYTQAPLIVKYMEDLCYLESRIHDRALKFILYHNRENYKNSRQFNLQSVFSFVLGKKTSEFASKYLFNTNILPLWYLADNPNEDPAQVINELNDFEYTLWTWFRLENPNYQRGFLKLDGLTKEAEKAEKAGLRFAGPDIEEQVKQLSPTVYYLLKQYTLRVK